MHFKPFTSADWDTFGGCEEFDNGSEPLITWFKLTHDAETADSDAAAVIDGCGLAIAVDGGCVEYMFSAPFAARAVAMLRDGMTVTELEALPGCESIFGTAIGAAR